MAVLDTSAIIHLLYGTQMGVRLREKYMEEFTTTTVFSTFELLPNTRSQERTAITAFLAGLEMLDFNARAAHASVAIEEELKKKGRPINKIDVMIAAICIVHGLPLITTDKDFEQISGLVVYSALVQT